MDWRAAAEPGGSHTGHRFTHLPACYRTLRGEETLAAAETRALSPSALLGLLPAAVAVKLHTPTHTDRKLSDDVFKIKAGFRKDFIVTEEKY